MYSIQRMVSLYSPLIVHAHAGLLNPALFPEYCVTGPHPSVKTAGMSVDVCTAGCYYYRTAWTMVDDPFNMEIK